jgi:5-methylcytosine-specific restriction endonuclease McrA
MENYHLCNECGEAKKQVKVDDYVYIYYCENYCFNSYLEHEIGCMYEDHIFKNHVWTTSDNRKVVSSICSCCGEKERGGLKACKDKDKLPNGDHLIIKHDLLYKNNYNYINEKREAYKKKVKEIHNGKFWELYDEHIKSIDWLNIRQRILQRDKNLCQACLINDAQEVHHLTYQNLGNEFMFELISVCKPCHDRIHNKPQRP